MLTTSFPIASGNARNFRLDDERRDGDGYTLAVAVQARFEVARGLAGTRYWCCTDADRQALARLFLSVGWVVNELPVQPLPRWTPPNSRPRGRHPGLSRPGSA